MVNLKQSTIKINFLEKIIINFALPTDFVYHTLKSTIIKDQYSSQTIKERLHGLWHGKIDKYHKLRIIKEKYEGKIPDRVKNICKKTPCGYMRLLLTYFH